MQITVALTAFFLAAAQADPPAPLVGEWRVVSVEGDGLGKVLRENVASITIDAAKITAGRAADYTLDPARRTIDLTIDGGPKAERGTYLGVYERKGAELKLHFAMPGQARPGGFTAAGGSFVISLRKK